MKPLILAMLAGCFPSDVTIPGDTGEPVDTACPYSDPVDVDCDGVRSNVDCDDLDPAMGECVVWCGDTDGDGQGSPNILYPTGDGTGCVCGEPAWTGIVWTTDCSGGPID